MIPKWYFAAYDLDSILHVSGDDPMKKERMNVDEVYSPRKWR